MVRNIISKYPLSAPLMIYNRTPSRTAALAATLPPSKVIAATTLEAVAKANIIITCIADDAAVRTTIGSLMALTPSPRLFIDCSTIHPLTTNEIGELLTGAGHEFVAMPVFGAPAMADAGQLVCVPAGPEASVQRALPLTKAVGRAVIDLSGKAYGQATQLKVIGNAFILNMVEMLSEGHVLAEKSGVGSENLHRFIESILPGAYAAYSKRMMSGDYYTRDEPLFGVDLARKDARHALDLARQAGMRLEAVETADRHLAGVKERMGEKGDLPGIYGVLREEAGLPYENQSGKP